MTPKNERHVKKLVEPWAAGVLDLHQRALLTETILPSLATRVLALERLTTLTFLERLRWLFTGALTALPPVNSLDAPIRSESGLPGPGPTRARA